MMIAGDVRWWNEFLFLESLSSDKYWWHQNINYSPQLCYEGFIHADTINVSSDFLIAN